MKKSKYDFARVFLPLVKHSPPKTLKSILEMKKSAHSTLRKNIFFCDKKQN